MSTTISAFQRYISEHPETALDLNDVLFTLQAEGKLTSREIAAIHQHMREANLSFRAELGVSELEAAQPVSNVPGKRVQNFSHGEVVSLRSEVSRAHERVRTAAPAYGNALDILASYDPSAVQAVRDYVGALRGECAAARIYVRDTSGRQA
ncbi:hypothetical protein [Demequina iriomotensis]|uniref:hypothetical protein n=1 Tax=Demequina iriomotensis TaxID=1536641 RepID=UPI0007803B83|nr:hypothetical protein [Demequina iriomotensis]